VQKLANDFISDCYPYLPSSLFLGGTQLPFIMYATAQTKVVHQARSAQKAADSFAIGETRRRSYSGRPEAFPGLQLGFRKNKKGLPAQEAFGNAKRTKADARFYH
jgi:hypothetical protein